MSVYSFYLILEVHTLLDYEISTVKKVLIKHLPFVKIDLRLPS